MKVKRFPPQGSNFDLIFFPSCIFYPTFPFSMHVMLFTSDQYQYNRRVPAEQSMQADREVREYPLEFSLVFHVIGLYSYNVCTYYTTVALWKGI